MSFSHHLGRSLQIPQGQESAANQNYGTPTMQSTRKSNLLEANNSDATTHGGNIILRPSSMLNPTAAPFYPTPHAQITTPEISTKETGMEGEVEKEENHKRSVKEAETESEEEDMSVQKKYKGEQSNIGKAGEREEMREEHSEEWGGVALEPEDAEDAGEEIEEPEEVVVLKDTEEREVEPTRSAMAPVRLFGAFPRSWQDLCRVLGQFFSLIP
jgi:hypothetical protein